MTHAGLVLAIHLLLSGVGCSPAPESSAGKAAVPARQGDLSNHGGTRTVRESFERRPDNPSTTNDESNDQPVGHFGTITMIVSQQESGHTYTLDVEFDDLESRRIYFPRGGWVDLEGCELEGDLTGECVDENGRHWTFEGVRQ